MLCFNFFITTIAKPAIEKPLSDLAAISLLICMLLLFMMTMIKTTMMFAFLCVSLKIRYTKFKT